MIHIGIDPGVSGGISAINNSGVVEYLAPLKKFTLADIVVWLDQQPDPKCCVLERVRSSPQMGVVSAFTFGQGYGRLEATLAALRIPYAEVTPQTWQTAMKCKTKGDKNTTRFAAQKLFPELKVTHYNADALLIATYCRRFMADLF